MKRFLLVLTAVLLLVAAGCVIRTEHTIDAHITLDIRHIADEAEDILDFIESDAPQGEAPGPVSWIRNVLRALDPMPAAYAAELKSVSPAAKEIALRMRERNAKVAALKEQGCLGENNRGYVELRECDALADAEARNSAQKLLAEENKDRKALHNEIARINQDQEGLTVSVVEGVYAMQRLKRAKPGGIFQLPPASEAFDEFKKSRTGRELGDAFVPEAWVTIP